MAWRFGGFMGSRRAFLKATAAMAAVSASAQVRTVDSGAVPGVKPAIPLYRVIGDRRFAESVAYALEARRLGHVVSMMDGDITDLWSREIGPRWEHGPIAIGGLTTHGPLFCLERWAWDKGMRVVMRAVHRRQTVIRAPEVSGNTAEVERLFSWVIAPKAIASLASGGLS